MKRYILFLLPLLLFSNINTVYANDLLYTPHPNLDYIAVNNDVVTREQEGFLKIYKQDTVKIAGIGNPDDTVKVTFDEYEYSATVDDTSNWFVLFSVQDMKVGSYPVSIQFNDGKQEHLNTLVIQEGDMKVSDYSTPQQEAEEVEEEKDNSNLTYILIAISIPVLLAIGGFGGIYISKKRKK